MRYGEADRVLTLLEVYWPSTWSPRNSKETKKAVKDELDDMFRDYSADEVLGAIRKLGRSADRAPTYGRILKELADLHGNATEDGLGYHWEQYIYRVYRDKFGREYAKTCNVKVFDDGSFELPKGVPYNERMLKVSGLLDPDKEQDEDQDGIPEGFQVLIEDCFRERKGEDHGRINQGTQAQRG